MANPLDQKKALRVFAKKFESKLSKIKVCIFDIDGILYENVRVEQTYKGNFHLLCEIQGKERKFVISKNKAAYAEIEETGTSNLSIEQLHTLVETYLAR